MKKIVHVILICVFGPGQKLDLAMTGIWASVLKPKIAESLQLKEELKKELHIP